MLLLGKDYCKHKKISAQITELKKRSEQKPFMPFWDYHYSLVREQSVYTEPEKTGSISAGPIQIAYGLQMD